MIFLLNGLIAFCCMVIAVIEYAQGHGSISFAYTGFGLGYVGLALMYMGF